MDIRKCVYTGLQAKCKDTLIPKSILGNEIHNWVSEIPCNTFYKELKKDKNPNELELMAFEYFYMLEIAKVKVKYYENKLKEVQDKIGFRQPSENEIVKKHEVKVEKEEREARHLQVNLDEANDSIDKHFENMKREIF